MTDRLRHVRTRFSGMAFIRAFWHMVVRRYRYEVCFRCGRPVGRATGSWWSAPDDLWLAVEGSEGGIRCPACFTADCAERGVHVRWEAVVDA